jgi:hypothetical protein
VPIIDRNGRPRSVRTDDEDRSVLLKDIARLPPMEQIAVMEMYEELRLGQIDSFESVAKIEYTSSPVDIRTFLTNPYFLGETGSSLWPQLVEDMVELFEGHYHEVALTGSLGWGKSFFATTALAYVLYQMSCLRDPQKAYDLDGGSHIYLAMLSVTEKVARRVAINEFVGKVSHSRYFKEKFPPQAAPSALEIRFPRQIQVVAGSTGSSAIIGLNAFAGFIDESSFMGAVKEIDRGGRVISVDKGEAIYKSIIRRMKSRFQKAGRLPGLMIIASSKERPSAFVEQRIQQAREQNDSEFFVREYSTWDVKPSSAFTGRFFKVAVGDEKLHSRILSGDPDEEIRLLDSGMRVMDVPEEYRQDFERDLEGSLRDIAGVATVSVSPYIQRSEQIYGAVDDSLPSPVGGEDSGDMTQEWTAGTPLTIHWGRIATPREMRLPGGYTEIKWRPKRNPTTTRYAHIDPSLTGDSTGLAIGHISGWTEVVRRDPAGEEYNELAPVIETDLLLRISPPPGDEILLSDVRSILYQFHDHGFALGYVTMDQYQSADAIQQFRKRGIESEVVSVDRTTEAYDVLKTALYEGRLRLHRNDHCLRELSQLQRVPKPGGRGIKIDHPRIGADGMPGSKDLADALAALVFNLTQRTPGMPVAPQLGVSTDGRGEVRDDSWVNNGRLIAMQETSPRRPGRGIVDGGTPSAGTMPPMPFIKG